METKKGIFPALEWCGKCLKSDGWPIGEKRAIFCDGAISGFLERYSLLLGGDDGSFCLVVWFAVLGERLGGR